jgi:hypothetical protein
MGDVQLQVYKAFCESNRWDEVNTLVIKSPLNSEDNWTPSLQHMSLLGGRFVVDTTQKGSRERKESPVGPAISYRGLSEAFLLPRERQSRRCLPSQGSLKSKLAFKIC